VPLHLFEYGCCEDAADHTPNGYTHEGAPIQRLVMQGMRLWYTFFVLQLIKKTCIIHGHYKENITHKRNVWNSQKITGIKGGYLFLSINNINKIECYLRFVFKKS